LPFKDMTFPTPEAAESAFYAAFEARSLDAMMAVWAGDDSIACIHPLAAPLNGHARWRRAGAACSRRPDSSACSGNRA
jgi:hypothetical protein